MLFAILFIQLSHSVPCVYRVLPISQVRCGVVVHPSSIVTCNPKDGIVIFLVITYKACHSGFFRWFLVK